MSDAPGPNDAQAEYWEDRSSSWIDSEGWWLTAVAGPFGAAALDRLEAQPGGRYLDIGCGTGPTSIELARRIQPGGVVEGVDISPSMIATAQARAADAGVGGITFRVADVQVAELGDHLLDGVVSQFGVMFFADPTAAFTNVRGGMRPGSNLSFCCWQQLFSNEWMFVPGAAAIGITGWMPEPLADGAPGPFGLCDANRIDTVLDGAGFRDIDILDVRAEVVVPEERIDDAVRSVSRIGAVREQVERFPDQREAIIDAVRSELHDRLDGGHLTLASAAWAVRATA
ncbi:class I SAM-dependent methyltransferase [Dermatobacter hominis]|uniref:class I SAM-dependent methyltransferase n=1 Tax=Dermatobacter hominis TaxID=2884263 RepID=UPI001D125B4D|nr:class I SAM-dependent methyltransferase [Dermatobacter hominis]UDY34778.1 methyltransferase domain-containing protein [Dermatobacter hominis]